MENLEKKLGESHIQTSRATIYRTLELLVESKLIDRIRFSENSYYYEYSYGQELHYHLICNNCQKIIEFISEDIKNISEAICKKYSFRDPDYQFKIFGICHECSIGRESIK